MKKYISIFLLAFIVIVNLSAQAKKVQTPDYYGERIEYALKVGIFQIGKVEIQFSGDTLGCDAYLYCNAKSTGVVKVIKDVQYTFDAYVDTTTGYAYKSSRTIQEGSFNDYDEVHYDRTSRDDSTIVTTEDNDTLIIQKEAVDILLAFFQYLKNYLTHSMQEGEVTRMKTYFVDKEWDLNITYVGKEKVESRLGTAKCFKLMPETEVGEYFKSTDDMIMWVTANKWLIPLKFELDLKVGTLTADIVSYQKPRE